MQETTIRRRFENVSRALLLGWCVGAFATQAACSKDPHRVLTDAIASGDRHFAAKQYAEAAIDYRRGLQADGLSGEARFKLARTYMQMGDAQGAYEQAVRAADLLPNDLEAQLQAARVLILGQAFQDAKQRALVALKIDPKNVDAQILLGNAMVGLKDLPGAIQQIHQAIDTDPRNSLSYTNLGRISASAGDKAAAEAAFKRAVDLAPGSEGAHAALANFYWASGNFPAAEEQLKEAVKAAPTSVLANQAIATFYIQQKQPAQAEQYLKAYVQSTNRPEAQLVLADFYSSIEKPAEAKAILESLTARPEFFGRATVRLAILDFTQGHPDATLRQLDAVLAREPKNEDARLLKAHYLLNDGKISEALTLVRAAIADNQASPMAHYAEGVLLSASGDGAGATKSFQEALRLDSSLLGAQMALAKLTLARGDASGAAQYAGQILATVPRAADAHLILGRALAMQGRADEALRELQPLARDMPKSADLHNAMGLAYVVKRDGTSARREYTAAFEAAPDSIEAVAGLVSLDLAEHQQARARDRISALLQRQPKSSSAAMLAGQTYVTLGDTAAAEAAFRKVIDLDPSRLDAYGGLARIYVAQKRLDEAARELEQAAERQPKNAGLRTMIGMVYDLKHQPDEATKHYQTAVGIDPRAAVASNNLAQHYADKGENLDQALQLAQTAKRGLPDQPEIDDTLGWVYYKQKQAALAISAFKRCVEAKPANPTFLAHLGLAYAQNDNRELARQSLRKALAMQPDFDGAEDARAALKSLGG